MTRSLRILFCLLISATQLPAWSGPGHMTVAAIAYRNLSPEVRQKATDLLKNHYEYSKWKAEIPENDKTMDEGIVAFMGASKWPDEIKYGNSTFNHKEWHYVDFPLIAPDFPIKPSPAPGNDIIYAIDYCTKTLKDPKTTDKAKAYWLCWLIHIVGDISQPLHCCCLVNDDFPAPMGDRGGNLIFVRQGTSKGVALHKMWDDAMGKTNGFHTKQLRGYVNQAIELDSEFKRDALGELKKNTTAESWARESRQIAVDRVYLHGQLKYGKTAESAVDLPDGYTKNLKMIAQRQVAITGYRLADLIREVLNSK